MARVIVIGGGIIGLSSAYYLRQSGWEVTVIDQNGFSDNCSYGNCGYVCPSHFIPLSTPGIVRQGLKWMWNSSSPFYVQPRLSRSLINWGLKFMRSATPEKVEAAAIPLRDIAVFSQHEYEKWKQIPGFQFAYEHKGLLEIFQTAEKQEHAHHACEQAHSLGLDAAMLSAEQLQQLEPHTQIIAKGAVIFKCDAHLYPNKLMQGLIKLLEQQKVQLVNDTVTAFDKSNGSIKKVFAGKSVHEAEAVVVATGSWGRELVSQLDLNLPLVPGRGYSVTLENSPYHVNYPSVLMEGRVALTPMDGNKIRFGGTMEITSHKTPMRIARVKGILDAVKKYYPAFDVPLPTPEKVWYGYRPCSADGLPYIGRMRKWQNVVVATGHSMLGLSLGAGTGKLVNEILNNQSPSIDLKPFDVERFS